MIDLLKHELFIFKKYAKLCKKEYGIQYDKKEQFFRCPSCDEPVYFSDWHNNEDFKDGMCPICGNDFLI